MLTKMHAKPAHVSLVPSVLLQLPQLACVVQPADLLQPAVRAVAFAASGKIKVKAVCIIIT